jgi:hypothetical protein
MVAKDKLAGKVLIFSRIQFLNCCYQKHSRQTVQRERRLPFIHVDTRT